MLKRVGGRGVSSFRTEKIRTISGILIYPPLLPTILLQKLPEQFHTIFVQDLFQKLESSLGATNARAVIVDLKLNWKSISGYSSPIEREHVWLLIKNLC